MTRGSSRARQPLSRVNLTGFTMPTSGKNRKYICIQKKKNLKTSLKTGFAQISLPAQKTQVTQNFGGAAAPLAPPPPPGPYAYVLVL